MFNSCVSVASAFISRPSRLIKGHTSGAKGHASNARTMRAQLEMVGLLHHQAKIHVLRQWETLVRDGLEKHFRIASERAYCLT